MSATEQLYLRRLDGQLAAIEQSLAAAKLQGEHHRKHWQTAEASARESLAATKAAEAAAERAVEAAERVELQAGFTRNEIRDVAGKLSALEVAHDTNHAELSAKLDELLSRVNDILVRQANLERKVYGAPDTGASTTDYAAASALTAENNEP